MAATRLAEPLERIMTRMQSEISEMTPEEIAAWDARNEACRSEEAQRRTASRYALFREAVGARFCNARLSELETFGSIEDQAKQIECHQKVCDWSENLSEHVNAGCGVVFYGPVGTGKSHIACALLGRAMVRMGITGTFRSAIDIISDARALGSESIEKSKVLRQKRVLLIDDLIPPGGLTQFAQEVIFKVIDARYRERLSTWATINIASKAEMTAALGPAIVDRLLSTSEKFFMSWPSVRDEVEKQRIADASGEAE